MLRELVHLSAGEKRPALTDLRWVVPTGDALPAELCQAWLGLYPHIPLLNTYGSTECSDDQCHYPITHLSEEWTPIMTIGTPIPNMRAYVLDRALDLAPIGVSGELYIGGIGVGRGYLADPVRTAQAFLPDPYSQEAGRRLYKTGDVARFHPAGTLEFLGRADHLVKIRGYRIEPGEIEVVLQGHLQVQTAVVTVRPGGDGAWRLVAYVVPANPEQPPDARDLRAYTQSLLPEYMVPSAFVIIEALPLTSHGKLDRQALPDAVFQEERAAAFVPPRTAAEEIIAGFWQEALGVERVGIYDDFFSLGGHSLLATRVIARVCLVFQVELSLRSLFDAPTVEGQFNEVVRACGSAERVEEIAQVFKEIGQLTDEEIQQQLGE